jgi:large subunit ribosomal protein L29
MIKPELRNLTEDELLKARNAATEELFKLRFQHHTGQLTNTSQLRATRRQIARINTLIQERGRAARAEG